MRPRELRPLSVSANGGHFHPRALQQLREECGAQGGVHTVLVPASMRRDPAEARGQLRLRMRVARRLYALAQRARSGLPFAGRMGASQPACTEAAEIEAEGEGVAAVGAGQAAQQARGTSPGPQRLREPAQLPWIRPQPAQPPSWPEALTRAGARAEPRDPADPPPRSGPAHAQLPQKGSASKGRRGWRKGGHPSAVAFVQPGLRDSPHVRLP